MPSFRLASRFTRTHAGEPRSIGYPFTHVRVLRSSVDLEEARDQALAFESAAQEVLRARIERYADLGRPRVVAISDDGQVAATPLGEREEPAAGSESGLASDEGYFSPKTGVA
jgi:hypothetical protein